MGYYAGDFYAGARGDPGFLGSLFGSIGSIASSFVPGGGVVRSAVSSVVSRFGRGGGAATAGRGVLDVAKGAITRHPVLSAAGAAGALGAGALGVHALGRGRKCHRRTAPSAKHPMGKCIRRVNVLNPRALRRALRRTHGFANFAMKCIRLTHPKKKGRFAGFKPRKKKGVC